MAAQTIEILPPRTPRDLTAHGMDDETKAMLGFLARYHGRTLENYELDLKQFKEWTLSNGIGNMLRAERWQLELYVRHMVERGLAASTISRRYGTVRSFYRMAHADGLITKDPAYYVRTPKVEVDQQYRTWFESVDMAIMLRMATAPVDRAVLQIMFDLALRVGELCGLDVTSLARTPAGPVLRFIGKGNKLAVMMVPPASMSALDRYLDGREDGPMFVNRYGNRLARRNVQAIIDRGARQAGITYHVSPHGIRRTSCRFGIQNGESIDQAADRLRHADSRVTKASYAIDTGMADIHRAQISARMANLAR